MRFRAMSVFAVAAILTTQACADVLTRADGGRYVGQVVGGKAEGEGTETRPDGTVFKGRFAQDVFVQGTMRSGGWVVPFSNCHSVNGAAPSQAARN
jgi:hypothetical protein